MHYFRHLHSLLFLLLAGASAHMEMVDPPSFKNKKNPNANGDIDYSNTSPLATDGSNFPCKGYHKLLGTPAGAAVAHWKPGSTQSITIAGQAWHNGGSCQISLSLDGGKSFTVIHSYIGNCPSGPGDRSMSFRIPSDAPSSDSVLLSWSWFNNLGNREFYHQCAPITMSGKRRRGSEKVSFNSRPQIFMANIGNGCKTIETKDVLFPNPGPDVTVNNGNTEPPVGDCGLSRGGVEWSGPSSDQLPPPDLSSPEVPPTSGNDDSPNFGDATDFRKGNDWPGGFNAGQARSKEIASVLRLEGILLPLLILYCLR